MLKAQHCLLGLAYCCHWGSAVPGWGKGHLKLLRGGTAPSRNMVHGDIRLRVEGLWPSQQTQIKFPIWKCQSCFLGLRRQSRLLSCFHISTFVLSHQREKEPSYPSLKEIKCCTIQILFQGGNVGFFSFNCLFSSLYKINIVSSV